MARTLFFSSGPSHAIGRVGRRDDAFPRTASEFSGASPGSGQGRPARTARWNLFGSARLAGRRATAFNGEIDCRHAERPAGPRPEIRMERQRSRLQARDMRGEAAREAGTLPIASGAGAFVAELRSAGRIASNVVSSRDARRRAATILRKRDCCTRSPRPVRAFGYEGSCGDSMRFDAIRGEHDVPLAADS